MLNYIFALDLSISCSGIAVFTENGDLLEITSIKTNPKHEQKNRLKIIGDKLEDLRDMYDPRIIVIERGFTKHNIATQVLYRVHGLANYIFYNCKQIYYAPTTIKKSITGSGKSDKEELKQIILQDYYPNAKFKNNDESDAVAIGLTYFIKEKQLVLKG